MTVAALLVSGDLDAQLCGASFSKEVESNFGHRISLVQVILESGRPTPDPKTKPQTLNLKP